MKLNIFRPNEKKIVDIQWIDIQTSVGSFVIQPKHAPMILTLKDNTEVSYKLVSGSLETEKVNYGIAHINRDFVTLLINN